MSIEQTDVVDYVTIDKSSGNLWLTISDHLPWSEGESDHLILLQGKMNSYLRFIESGEMETTIPESKGRTIVINLVSKYELGEMASLFISASQQIIGAAGYEFRLDTLHANE